MEIKGKAHLMFEQSGVFKNEFKKLGIPAYDYDLQNNFGETDYIIDLFAEIEKAYEGDVSIIDQIRYDDITLAFFPCVYFGQHNTTFFNGTNLNWKNETTQYKVEQIIERSKVREHYYEVALKMFSVFDTRGLRLIVENPYTAPHYLTNNFPYKPSLIDKNRQQRGDYFKKPTQYWFVNCEPTQGYTYSVPPSKKVVNTLSGHQGSLCDEDRSLISPDYARNLICDNILGLAQQYTQLSLF